MVLSTLEIGKYVGEYQAILDGSKVRAKRMYVLHGSLLPSAEKVRVVCVPILMNRRRRNS